MTRSHKQTQLNAALDLYQVGLAADGDRRAFELLYRRWHPRLLRLAVRLTGNADEARDVMQDAALTIARDIHKLENPERFSAWAYTIIRRRAADHIHRAVRSRKAVSEIPTDIIENTVERTLSLKQALAQLNEVDRLMLTLFYVEGLRGTEIAAALGIPLGTLKSRLFTARSKLRQIYDTTKGEKND